MIAAERLQEFLANTEPPVLELGYASFRDEPVMDQRALKGAIQLAVLEGKITSSVLRDGGGYRLTRVKGAAHKPLPVSGYTPQSDAKVALVNEFKIDEERLLRKTDDMLGFLEAHDMITGRGQERPYDPRWIAIARTHFQEGFMALNRAIAQPQRIKLPEDDPTLEEALERSDLP